MTNNCTPIDTLTVLSDFRRPQTYTIGTFHLILLFHSCFSRYHKCHTKNASAEVAIHVELEKLRFVTSFYAPCPGAGVVCYVVKLFLTKLKLKFVLQFCINLAIKYHTSVGFLQIRKPNGSGHSLIQCIRTVRRNKTCMPQMHQIRQALRRLSRSSLIRIQTLRSLQDRSWK